MKLRLFRNLAGIPFLLLFQLQYLEAQDKELDASLYNSQTIPDSLKKDAESVVRYSNMEIVVKSPSKAIIRSHIIQTILNEKHEDEAVFGLGYDKKFSAVNYAEMLVYDASGKLIKRYKKSDMYDRSAVDGISILTDSRVLLAQHVIASYPLTIEKKYERELNSFLDLNGWYLQDEDIAVQNAYCKVTVNPSVGFRYKSSNIEVSPKKTSDNEFDVYTWQVQNLKPIKVEEGSPYWRVMPRVLFATNNIEFDGLAGDLSSWKGFGLWQKNLNQNLSQLSPSREQEIRQMISGLNTDKDKAEFLYQYMQKNMRYVSIQLGIGGLKPFSASFVDEKKYGDCKALANYMYTLLKIAGIPSYYTLVNAGENQEPADPDFVNDPFNHIILCIPFKNDTTWLECTSSTQPFGKLGSFTENRNALLITDEGGKLVRTPASKMEDNVFETEAEVGIEDGGMAKAKIKIKSTGEYRDMCIGISREKLDDQKNFLIKYLNLRQPDIFDLSYGKDDTRMKEMELNLEYARLSEMAAGNKLFFRPSILAVWKDSFPLNDKRKSDYYFSYPMIKKNTTAMIIPIDFEVESLPENSTLQFSYGSYESRYVYDKENNKVISTSIFKLNNPIISASKYAEMQKFMDSVLKSSSKKLVIKKKA